MNARCERRCTLLLCAVLSGISEPLLNVTSSPDAPCLPPAPRPLYLLIVILIGSHASHLTSNYYQLVRTTAVSEYAHGTALVIDRCLVSPALVLFLMHVISYHVVHRTRCCRGQCLPSASPRTRSTFRRRDACGVEKACSSRAGKKGTCIDGGKDECQPNAIFPDMYDIMTQYFMNPG